MIESIRRDIWRISNATIRRQSYRKNYVRAFDRMLQARADAGQDNRDWKTGEDVMRWWVGDDPRQISFMDEYMEE